jgi:excisionase family DNA binding protein
MNHIPAKNTHDGTGEPDALLTKKKVARLLSISLRTLEGWMRERRIEFIKIGKSIRFTPIAVERLKASCTVPATN